MGNKFEYTKLLAPTEMAEIRKGTMLHVQKIIGKKITLKTLAPEQFEQYHSMLSPIVRDILHLPSSTFEETKTFLKERLEKQKQEKTLFYTIFDNVDKKIIGSIEIRDPEDNPGQLGSWLNENYWGGGRYQEVLALSTKAYFDWKQVDQINAHVDVTNIRSIKAHQKFGFEIVEKFKRDNRMVYNMILKKKKNNS